MKNNNTVTDSRRPLLVFIIVIAISITITGYPVAIQSIQQMIAGAEVIVLGDIVNTLEERRTGEQEVVFQKLRTLRGNDINTQARLDVSPARGLYA